MTNQKQKHNPSPKVKSTPGPWGCYIEEAGRDHLAAKSAYVINSESENRYPKHYENQANARLIAAAPELLEALQDIINQYGDEPTNFPCSFQTFIRMAQQAVAKAGG